MEQWMKINFNKYIFSSSVWFINWFNYFLLKYKKPDPFYIILGPLAGLVAITAGCNSMTSVVSILVGIIGAIIVYSK